MLQAVRRTRSQSRSKDNRPTDAVRSHPHGKMRNQFLKADFIQQPHNLSYQWNNQVFLKERDYVKQAIQRCLYFLSSCKHTVILKDNQRKPRPERMDDWEADESKPYLQVLSKD